MLEAALWAFAMAVAASVISYIFIPKPKPPTIDSQIKDMEAPTADAGRPVPVVFGTVTVKGVNFLWYGRNNFV